MEKNNIPGNADNLNELTRLLQENLNISKQTYQNTEKIKKYFFWSKVFKSVKYIIIAGLIIAGFLYSKPYLKNIFGIYKTIYQMFISLSANNGETSDKNIYSSPLVQPNLDPAVLKQIQEFLENSKKP